MTFLIKQDNNYLGGGARRFSATDLGLHIIHLLQACYIPHFHG